MGSIIKTTLLKNLYKSDFFKNFNFYLIEKLLRGFLSLYILKLFSQYYPQKLFGQLIFNESIIFIVIAIAGLSLNKIIVRIINEKKFNHNDIIETSFTLNFISTLIAIIISLFLFDYKTDLDLKFYLSYTVQSLICLFIGIESFFDSKKTPSKYIVPKTIFFLLSFVGKLYSIIILKNIDYFLLANFLEYFSLTIYYGILFKSFKFKFFNYNKTIFNELLKSSFPLLLNSSIILLSTKFDQILIKNILGYESNAIYGASIKLIEYGIIIPSIIIKTLYPDLVLIFSKNNKAFLKMINRTFLIIMVYSITLIFIFNIFSFEITKLIFNDSDGKISKVLKVLTPLIFLHGVQYIFNNLMYIHKLEKKYLLRSIFVLLINVTLNLFLIPILGIEGAVLSTLISFSFSSIIFHAFDKKLRNYFKVFIGNI